jgi:hypothetical protein
MNTPFLSGKASRFLLFGAGGYILWLLLYYFIIKVYTNWDYVLDYNIVSIAQTIFSWFDVQSHIELESEHVILLLDKGNYRGIWVGDQCNGFKLFSIFSIFILAFPGPIKKKMWFIPLGIVFIHFANVLRVIALLLINNFHP